MFQLLLSLLTIIIPGSFQDDVLQRHEQFLSYLPDGGYMLISYTDYEAVRNSEIVQANPEEFSRRNAPSSIPFSESEVTFAYSARPATYFSGRKGNRSPRMGDRPGVGVGEQMQIVEIPGLALLVDAALKEERIIATGEQIGEFPVYTATQTGQEERTDQFFCIPEPDVLVLCSSVDGLRSMVAAGRGEARSFVDEESFLDIIEYTNESSTWALQLYSDAMEVMRAASERRGLDQERIEAMEHRFQMMPLARLVHVIYEDDRYRQIDENIFLDEEAAQAYLDRQENVMVMPQRQEERIKEPEEITRNRDANVEQKQSRQVDNRIIRERIITIEYVKEDARLRKKYAEYYEKLKEQRQEMLEEREKER